MPKLKLLLRKLHIDSGYNGHTNRLTATATPSQRQSPSPTTGAIGAVDSLSLANINSDSNCSDVEFSFYEEEFQMQLALAISVSSGSAEATARLPHTPESVVEFLSLRYWSNNVVNYDEKVTDGFYDVYGIASNSVTRGKMPSLVDLQATRTGNDDVDYEVTLVDRRTDKELQHLEERVSNISLECQATGMSQIISRLVVKIAVIVVAHMGGPVNDADEMSRRWTTRSYELRNTLKTIPLGSIDCGLSRHRALLFKVLADKVNIASSLVKGSYYTGTDDGALNFIKIDNGRSHEGHLPGGGGGGRTSPAQNLQLKDISKCVINASKNPEFAQKLHAVLLKSGQKSSTSLINVNNKYVGETKARDTVHLLDADVLTFGGQCSNKQYQISFTEAEVSDVNDNSQSTSKNIMNDYAVVKPMDEDDVPGGGSYSINEKRTNNIRKNKKSDMKLTDTSGIGYYPFSNHGEGISLDEVEWEIPWEDLRVGGRIGIGSYGEVYRSEWHGTEVAVKKLMNQDISGDALTQFKGEIEIMLRLRHPNVVLFMGAVTRPPNLSILTEFLPRGSLFKLLHRSNVQLDERRRLHMALDVAKGMNYLHTSNPMIVHRDLKTPNLLVDRNWVVKVCDFGMSQMKHHTFLSSKSTAGTPEWMAPEVMRNEPSNEKSDVYSFGVILWELATLCIPWTEINSMQVVGAVGFQFRHLDIPEHVDHVAARIISDCWHPEPQSRPSFKEIIARIRSLGHLSMDRSNNQTS